MRRVCESELVEELSCRSESLFQMGCPLRQKADHIRNGYVAVYHARKEFSDIVKNRQEKIIKKRIKKLLQFQAEMKVYKPQKDV